MFFILCAVVAVLLVMYWYRRPAKFPDGPRGYPLLGITPTTGTKSFGQVFTEYQKTYGSIFSARVGREDWVVLNKFGDIYETMVRRAHEFSGRQSIPLFNVLTNKKGLAFLKYDHFWDIQRKFGLRMLRGAAVETKEGKIVDEAKHLVAEISKQEKNAIDPYPHLFNAVFNVTASIVCGKRYDYEDKKFKKFIDILKNSFAGVQGKHLALVQFAFWTRNFPLIKDSYERFLSDGRYFMAEILQIAEEHKKTYAENTQRDFIDGFLKEMMAKTDDSFEFEQLSQYIRDLYDAGTKGTSNTVLWCVLCFLEYPKYQEKVYSEIKRVIGSSHPSMKHRDKMHYTAAFIYEIMRHRTMVPTSVMHTTTENVELKGYFIPKNTTVIANIWAVHHDPELFKNADEFHPERFIDKDGNFARSQNVIPFGVGPRQCIGKQIVDMEVFLFVVTLVQNFEIVRPTNDITPSFHDGGGSFTYTPKPFKAVFIQRQ